MGIHNGKGRLARVDVSFELDFVSELFGLKKGNLVMLESRDWRCDVRYCK